MFDFNASDKAPTCFECLSAHRHSLITRCRCLPVKEKYHTEKYRLSGPTLAMYDEEGIHVGRLLPDGATIFTDGKKFNGEKPLSITWNDKPMMILTQDVQKRGTPIE